MTISITILKYPKMKSTIHDTRASEQAKQYRKNNFKIMSKTLLLSLLFLPFVIQAQVSPNVSKRYPAHIVYKIGDVLAKIKLSEDKQIMIAQKFVKIDSIANASLANGGSIDLLKSYYTIDNKFLKDILSVEEMEKYSFETNKDNRFLAALINATLLKLDPTQVNKIRHLNDSLDTTPKRVTKETIQFQNRKLSKILNQQQYLEVIKFSYKDQSLADAKTDWEKILKLKINTPGKELEEFRIIVGYHFAKNSFLDKKADRHEKTMRDFLAIKATLFEPPLLMYANILSKGKLSDNKYASVIQCEKELGLSKSQIDTLLVKYHAFEKIKMENKENELNGSLTPPKQLPLQFENIVKIINPEQTNKWLIIKNKKEAFIKANKSWATLETEGLTKDLDKEKTIKELAVYHLKYLVASERAKNWKTPETLFLVRDAVQKKPDLLLQLDAITRSKVKSANAKSALTW